MLYLNLLPWRSRSRERRRRIFVGELAGAAVAAAALGFAFGAVFDHQFANQQQRNGFLANAVAQLDARIAALDALRREQQALLQREQALARLWTGRSDTARILDDVAQALVPGLHFVALKKEGRVLAAHGIAATNNRVAALMRNIRDSSHLKAPLLKNIGDAAGALYGNHAAAFELAFEVRLPGEAGAVGQSPRNQLNTKDEA